MNKVHPKNQWLALNQSMNTLKIVSLILGVLLAASLFSLRHVATLPPVVIEKSGGSMARHSSYRSKNDDITTEEIKRFVRTFIGNHYGRSSTDDDESKGFLSVKPLVTEDFYSLILRESKKRNPGLRDISQYVGNLKVSVTEKDVVATFDKIIRIKGIPMVSPSQVSLKILKDSPNRFNPWGLYVNGLVVYEEAPQ